MAAAASSPLGRFVAALRSCGVQPSERVAVALSGGPDSLALASMTVWWQRFVRQTHPPLALIVDHRLRPESSAEAAAVAAAAAGLGLEPHVLAVEWAELPAPGDRMVAAREARYALLLRACARLGRTHLLLAHHADDQAETFLLRLIHASGVTGLACMPPLAEKSTEHGRVKVVRPLLGFRKAELEGYCQRGGLPYVTDPTNSNLSYHRHATAGLENRIRHVLQQMPALPPGADAAPLVQEQPAAGPAAQQAIASGSDGDGSSSGDAAGDAPAAPAAASSSGGGSSIVHDILRLQRRCEAAMQQQAATAERLLRSAVLHTSLPDLPCQPKQPPRPQPRPGRRLPPAEMKRQWLKQQPWYADWEARLELVARTLRPLPFALLDAACFAGLEEPLAVGALSRLLHAVSGRQYPPPLAHTIRLHKALLGGRLDAAHAGGGCQLKRLSQCKGRYVLCLRQSDWDAAQALLAQLPPLTEVERRRQQRKEAAAAARAAAEAAAVSGGGDGGGGEQRRRAA